MLLSKMVENVVLSENVWARKYTVAKNIFFLIKNNMCNEIIFSSVNGTKNHKTPFHRMLVASTKNYLVFKPEH